MKKIRKEIVLLAAVLCFATLQAAMVHQKNRPVPVVSAEANLKEFEGFYRFPNRVAYIQFEVVSNQLQAKQVWDNRQYVLVQTGDLAFESLEEQYKIVFDKLPPTSVKILERVTLSKVDFDPTKRIPLSPSIAKRYIGRYHLQRDPSHTIDVTVEEENLVLVQQWDGKRIPLKGITEQEFINQDMAMPVTFDIRESQAVEMRCFEEDIWVKEKN